jgi:hypothetical protein
LNALYDGLACVWRPHDFENIQGMVNKALVLQNRRGMMERKRKVVHQHQLGISSRLHFATPTAGPVFRPAQLQSQLRPQTVGQGFSTPQWHVIQCPNNFQTPGIGSQNVQRTHVALDSLQAERRCFACGEKGHFANRCLNSCPHANPPVATTPAPTPTHGANSIPVAAKQNYVHGKVNHVAVEEA